MRNERWFRREAERAKGSSTIETAGDPRQKDLKASGEDENACRWNERRRTNERKFLLGRCKSVVRFVSLKPPLAPQFEKEAPRFLATTVSQRTSVAWLCNCSRRSRPETYAVARTISDNDGMRALDAPYAVFMRAPRLIGKDKKPNRAFVSTCVLQCDFVS